MFSRLMFFGALLVLAMSFSLMYYGDRMKPSLMEMKDGPGETQKFRLTQKDGTKKCYFKTPLSDELQPTDCSDFGK